MFKFAYEAYKFGKFTIIDDDNRMNYNNNNRNNKNQWPNTSISTRYSNDNSGKSSAHGKRFQTFYRIDETKRNESEINSNQTLTENEMEIADCNLHIYLFIWILAIRFCLFTFFYVHVRRVKNSNNNLKTKQNKKHDDDNMWWDFERRSALHKSSSDSIICIYHWTGTNIHNNRCGEWCFRCFLTTRSVNVVEF